MRTVTTPRLTRVVMAGGAGIDAAQLERARTRIGSALLHMPASQRERLVDALMSSALSNLAEQEGSFLIGTE